MMNANVALVVAGIVFSIVALIHLVRLYTKFEIIIAGTVIPMWGSVLGLIISLGLAIWMFMASRS